jgi:hypothetical protein
MSEPGVNPARSIASSSRWIAASLDGRFGANPPSSPTVVDMPLESSSFLSVWKTCAP